ncbi:NADPH-dependent FMN reductase [Enterococcus nangangensis]
MKKLIGLVGTNSDASTNRKLLQYMQKHFANEANIELMEIKDLPLFNKPQDKKIPDLVKEMAAKIEASDGVIISTPEYDHAIPAALANALHWLSFGVFPFVDKPVMITGASYGTLGSSRAQAQLRQILDSPELQGRIMPNSEYLLGHSLQAFDEEGALVRPYDIEKLDGLFADFLTFIELTSHLQGAHAANKLKAANFNWDNYGVEEENK